jgi:hypothetical protein
VHRAEERRQIPREGTSCPEGWISSDLSVQSLFKWTYLFVGEDFGAGSKSPPARLISVGVGTNVRSSAIRRSKAES